MTYAELACFTLLGWAVALLMGWAYWMSENRFKKLYELFEDTNKDYTRIERECRSLASEVKKVMADLEQAMQDNDDGDAWKRQ